MERKKLVWNWNILDRDNQCKLLRNGIDSLNWNRFPALLRSSIPQHKPTNQKGSLTKAVELQSLDFSPHFLLTDLDQTALGVKIITIWQPWSTVGFMLTFVVKLREKPLQPSATESKTVLVFKWNCGMFFRSWISSSSKYGCNDATFYKPIRYRYLNTSIRWCRVPIPIPNKENAKN